MFDSLRERRLIDLSLKNQTETPPKVSVTESPIFLRFAVETVVLFPDADLFVNNVLCDYIPLILL